jgi:pectin methylesterase-like acyl-CoA thioesterase
MCKWFVSRSIYCVLLFIALGFGGISNVQAAEMTITNLFPANNAVGVCADTKLWITFGTTPIVATDSNMHLQICKVSDDSVVYDINLHTLPSDSYGHVAAGWPASYKITLNGLTVNYEPFAVSSKTLEIQPSTRLAYNTEYYVKMTAGFCTDSGGNTSPAITDNVTWRFTTASAPTADHDYMVTLDGSGDFCTLQGAVDAVADSDLTRTLIRIKKGTYRELINIPASKINVTWLGEDRDTTIIAGYNRDLFQITGTIYRNMIKNYGNGFRMYNLTLHNTAPDNSGQAETIRNNGMECIAQNCKFQSYQDTVYFGAGQMYFKDSYIEGDTDYIWGSGTVYFDKCEVRSLSTESYITQPRAGDGANGLFLVDCNLTSPAGLTGCYLGRLTNEKYPYSQGVYINCTMPSTLILPVGWNPQSYPVADLRWWEYKSKDPSGNLIDVNSRLNPGSKQLDDANAAKWRDVTNVFSANLWNPKAIVDAPTASWQPHPTDGEVNIASALLTWSAGAGAESHVVYFGTADPPPYATEQMGTSYLLMDIMYASTTYHWRVDEKNSAGTTTGTVWSFTTSATLDSTPPSPNPMRWKTEPNATNTSTITMTATTATDTSGVEYYFTNITDSNHNSGWRDSFTYTDSGLVNNTTYTYKVKARDKSLNHNVTVDSNEASATTIRFICSQALTSDLDKNCQVDFLDYAIIADGWLETRSETEDINNGTFDSELTPWTVVDAAGATGIMTATFDGSSGELAGSALLQANTTGTIVNHHRFYQLIPVVIGNRYRFSGRWSGSLYDPNAGTRRNWTEVFIGFSPNTTPSTWGNIAYKRRFVAKGSSSNMNFPSDSNGIWGWEDITASPNKDLAPPAGGIFTANQPYMVVSFNLGGYADGGAIRLNADNISAVECPTPAADLNGDCEINMEDIEKVAEDWLMCHRSPVDECWQ